MKKTRLVGWLVAAIALAVFAFAVVVFAVFYSRFVHPDDARVAQDDPVRMGLSGPTRARRGSLLSSGWERIWEVDERRLAEASRALEAALPPGGIVRSARFKVEQQVFLPVGRYPARLDARDGIFIPAGGSLTLLPKLDGAVELRLGLWSPDDGTSLDVAAEGNGPAERLTVEPRVPDPNTRGVWYRVVGRWLDVDPDTEVPRWADRKLSLKLAPEAKIVLTCRAASSAGRGCVVSDPTAFAAPSTSAALPGNVLVVMIDTMRGDALGSHSPRLSRLAAASVNFQSAVAAGNMTSPSTNAFLSCRKPTSMGKVAFAYTLSADTREAWYATEQPSFPARFAAAGYDTAMIGNVSVISEVYGVGINHGFARQVAVETDGYDTAQTTREAIRWLRANGDHPFFLYVHYNGPHAPYRAPWRYLDATRPGWSHLKSYGDVLRWLYRSEIAYTDRYVGELLDELAALGLDQNTTIVLSADHGDQHSNRRFVGNTTGLDFEGAYFDHGATLYQDEIHVPLLIRKPGVAPRQVGGYVSALDVGPTLLEMAALDGGESCTGVSLASVVAGGEPTALPPRTIGSEAFQGRAIISEGRWKYIKAYEATDKRVYPSDGWSGRRRQFLVPEQLFDLVQDPFETTNLMTRELEVAERARAAFKAYYGIGERLELVIEAREGVSFEVAIDASAQPRVLIGDARLIPDGVTGRGPRRTIIALATDAAKVPSVVRFVGREAKVLMSGLRLPLATASADLPLEDSGEAGLLFAARESVAYLRRVEDDGREDRRLVVGNPAFDAVLRQWGYLNDQ